MFTFQSTFYERQLLLNKAQFCSYPKATGEQKRPYSEAPKETYSVYFSLSYIEITFRYIGNTFRFIELILLYFEILVLFRFVKMPFRYIEITNGCLFDVSKTSFEVIFHRFFFKCKTGEYAEIICDASARKRVF